MANIVHVLGALSLLFVLCGAASTSYDIIVYGATPGGAIAAISAAWHNASLKVALLEPTGNIGGMSVAGGIGFRDIGNETTMKSSIALSWANLNSAFYGVNYPVYQCDSYVMEASLWTLIGRRTNLVVFLNTSLVLSSTAVAKSNTTITSIIVANTSTPIPTLVTFTAKVFVDASYEGDLARFAGASYTYGRENNTQYGESLAGVLQISQGGSGFLPNTPVLATVTPNTTKLIKYIDPNPLAPIGSADDRMMGYSFRFCVTKTASLKTPFFAPPNYNASDFTILSRYIQTLVTSGKFPNGPGFGDIMAIFQYRNYPPGTKFDMCDSMTSAVTSDAINLNKGYVNGCYAKRDSIYQETLYYVLGMVYFLATDPSVPSATQSNVNNWGLCNDQWATSQNLPPQMYVREGLRIVGDFVLTQSGVMGGLRYSDSIALGSWAFDAHVVSRTTSLNSNGQYIANDEGAFFTGISGSGSTYEIPVRTVLPKISELTNLIVPVCHSASHVAYTSTRVEPTFSLLGEASGLLAAVAVSTNAFVQNVPVSSVQSLLTARGILFHAS